MGEFIFNSIVIIVGVIAYCYRKTIWKYMESPVYKVMLFWYSIFSKKIYWKHYKLITYISSSEPNFEILNKKEDEFILRTIDANRNPVMLWTISYDYSYPKKCLKVTCELIKQRLKVSKEFHAAEDDSIVFNSMLYAVNDLKFSILEK